MTEPALTSEDWAELLGPSMVSSTLPQIATVRTWASDETGYGAHGTAALCLHGQPFGFTWADVEMLRGFSATYDYEELADRIQALLPPQSTTGSEGA